MQQNYKRVNSQQYTELNDKCSTITSLDQIQLIAFNLSAYNWVHVKYVYSFHYSLFEYLHLPFVVTQEIH